MKSVLIIDDEPAIRHTISLVLSGHYSCQSAAGGKEALGMLGTHSFDVVLLDLFMPDMDGFELLPKVRKIAPTARIVTISGSDAEIFGDLLKTSRALGANASLRKPFSLDALRSVIEGT